MKKIILFLVLLILSSCSFSQNLNQNILKSDEKKQNEIKNNIIKVPDVVEKTNENIWKNDNKNSDKKLENKISIWNKDIEFDYCDGVLKYEDKNTYHKKNDILLLKKKLKEYQYKKSEYNEEYLGNNLNNIWEYCKNKDSTKYILWAYNDYKINGIKLFIYDKSLDLLKKTNIKTNVLNNIDMQWYYSSKDYWSHELSLYLKKYIKEKSNNQWFWKRKWNIIKFTNYWVWTNSTYLFYDFRSSSLKRKNKYYCGNWLTPAGKLSICFADVYYSFDYLNNIIYEDKICFYYIDDNWNINTLEKCSQDVVWKYKWYDLTPSNKEIKIYQNANKDISIIDVDLKKAWVSFWWVFHKDTKYHSCKYNSCNSKIFMSTEKRGDKIIYDLVYQKDWDDIYSFYRKKIKDAYWGDSNIFGKYEVLAVVNWQFFNANKDPTALSFPIKSNGQIINSYVDNDKQKKTIVIDKNWKVKILDWYKKDYLTDNNNIEVLVGINSKEDFSKNSSLW